MHNRIKYTLFLGPVFNVSVHSDNLTIYQGELADLLCIITREGVPLEPGTPLPLNFIAFSFQ